MRNVHPIYNIKKLMIKRELAKDPKLANENWERFLPQFKKKNVQRRKPHVVREKKEYTPFPPAPVPSKVDLQLESGEYFLSEHQRLAKKRDEKREASRQRSVERKRERDAGFEAPREDGPSEGTRADVGVGSSGARRAKRRMLANGQAEGGGGGFALDAASASPAASSGGGEVERLKQALIEQASSSGSKMSGTSTKSKPTISDFVVGQPVAEFSLAKTEDKKKSKKEKKEKKDKKEKKQKKKSKKDNK